MIFKPDEVTTLKKGSHINVELNSSDIRTLKRNFCGVYELFKPDNSRDVEYFDDLILFKNRYGTIHRRFTLYNLRVQKIDIYTLTENMNLKEVLKWFSQYGDVELLNTSKIDFITIENYRWISDIGDNVCYFNVATTPYDFKLNISNSKFLNKKVV